MSSIPSGVPNYKIFLCRGAIPLRSFQTRIRYGGHILPHIPFLMTFAHTPTTKHCTDVSSYLGNTYNTTNKLHSVIRMQCNKCSTLTTDNVQLPFCSFTFFGWLLSDDCDEELFNVLARSSRGVNLTTDHQTESHLSGLQVRLRNSRVQFEIMHYKIIKSTLRGKMAACQRVSITRDMLAVHSSCHQQQLIGSSSMCCIQ